MASSQCERNFANKAGMQLSYEENAKLNEMIKQAEQLCNSQDLVNRSAAVVAEHEGLTNGHMTCGATLNMDRDQGGLSTGRDQFPVMGATLNMGRDQGSLSTGRDQFQMMGRPNGQFGQDDIRIPMGPKGANGAGFAVGWFPATIIGAIVKEITVVVGTLTSQTRGPLRVYDSRNWAGLAVLNFPNNPNRWTPFTFSSMLETGVKVAVLYTGKNRANTECGWLLALAASKHGGRKVYAECGPMSNFYGINWANIGQKLESSGSTAKCSDHVTGTSVSASMVGAVKKELLAATFCG